ncbi:MAG: class I SAM-dependent methyltransferase [Acidobacteria bacterium]|nr:class I SAM-dependent methyltransferase [Acidobacteriota bacterium]
MEQHSYQITFEHEQTYWWYTARKEILKHLIDPLIEMSGKRGNLKILNIGCGTGILSETFKDKGEIVSLDFSHDALIFCSQRKLKNLISADAQFLPTIDSSFDFVFGFDIVEHLEDDQKGLNEVFRVLKPGGYIVLTVPAYEFLWSSFDDVNWHKRRYTRKSLKKILLSSGFTIKKLSYYNFFLFPLAAARRFYEKIFRKEQTEYYLPKVGKLTNSLFKNIFASEKYLLTGINLPFGVSLITIAQKPHQ